MAGDERWADLPESEARLAQVREIWELLVATNPRYDELRTDGSWGWARKSPTPDVAVRTVVKHDLVGQLRTVAQVARSKLRPGAARG
jgi:hypothetical protein